ncbi:hypothetical protein ABPG77_001342 [Micractinium sp. CCAP 211/92]
MWFSYLRWRAGRGRMNSVAAGQLRLAAARGRVQDLALLARLPDFQAGGGVDADLLGFTPLHAACVQGQAGAAVWLLQRGADLTKLKQDDWRDSTLHYAAGSGSMECVQALLVWGADPTVVNALGETPADVAAKAGHAGVAGYIRLFAAAAAAKAAASEPASKDGADANGAEAVATNGEAGGEGNHERNGSANGGASAPVSAALSNGSASVPDLPPLPTKEELIKKHIMDPFRAARARRQSKADLLAAAEAGEAGDTTPAQDSPTQGSPALGSQVKGSPADSVASEARTAATQSRNSLQASAGLTASIMGVGSEGGRNGMPATPEQKAALRRLVQRGFEGWGTPGTVPKRETWLFRPLAILTEFLGGVYLVWRALRTLRPGLFYLYSMPFWLAEFLAYCMSFCFVTSLFNMIERPERRVQGMLPPERVPHVDVFICTYSEPCDIVEPTAVAALNMNWPGTKLTVHILDDSNRPEMARLVRRLAFQCKYMRREAKIVYVARKKVKGVPHHAKAGNINSCLLKEGAKKGEFILVLDCDMIVHPDFLERTVGHFYIQKPEGKLPTPTKGDSRWVPKSKAAFIQTPQDFWNVDAADPMVHCARFFYGPMLQGRDGIGAAPCCGTGVVFRRDVLVSIGGQAYGSITEDYNSAMTLMSAGMATMYLNERLSFGMAPDHITDCMTQRLRWAMGAIQILMKDNPLRLPGLTVPQKLLFFEAAAHHYLAFSTIFMAVVPIVFLYSEVSPMVCAHLWEFALVFGAWYLCNRLMMVHLHRGTEGGMQELWRGSQMWVWMAPNHIKAIWKVLVAENPIVKKLFNFEIGFSVTKKDKEQDSQWASFKKALSVTWPHLLYLIAFISGCIYFIVTAAEGQYSSWQIMIFLSSIAWGMLIVLCIWPAIYTMLPRVETEAGWKIVWDPFEDPTKVRPKEKAAEGGPQGSRMLSFGAGSLAAGPSRLVRSSLNFLSSLHLPFTRGGGESGGQAQPEQNGAGVGGQLPTEVPAPDAANPGASAVVLRPAAPAASGSTVSPFSSPFGDDSSPGDSKPATVSLRGPSSAPSAFGGTAGPFATGGSAAGPFAAEAQQPMDLGRASSQAHMSIRIPPTSPTAGGRMRSSNLSQALGDNPYSPAAEVHRRRPMSNFGRVALRSRNDLVLTASALLTSMVLPERSSAAPGMVSVMLDGAGRVAPASPSAVAAAAAAQGRQGSHHLLPDLETASRRLDDAPAGSVNLPLEQLAALQYMQTLTGSGVEEEPAPTVGFGGWRGGGGFGTGAGPSASPFTAAPGTGNLSLTSGQLPVITELRLSAGRRSYDKRRSLDKRRSGKGMQQSTMLDTVAEGPEREAGEAAASNEAPAAVEGEDACSVADSEDSLVEELAEQAKEEAGQQRVLSDATSDRVTVLSRHLVDLAASLCPANASMLLDQGYSLAVPVVPTSIYEHTLVARPNFRERDTPGANWMFLIVNGALLACLVAGSILDVKLNKGGASVTGTIGF